MSTTSAIKIDTTNSRPAFAAWYAVAVLMLMYMVSFLDRQVMSLLVAPIRTDLGITDFQLSLLHGFAFVIFYTLFGFPIGVLVDRMSRRTIIYVGVTIWSLATAACGVAQNFPQLLLARMAVGAGEASGNPVAYSIISDAFPKRGLTLALAIYASGAAIGAAISIFIAGSLISATAHMNAINLPYIGEFKPWRAVFIIIGLPGVLLALLNFTMLEPKRRGKISTGKVPLLETWRFLKSRRTFFVCHFFGFSLIQLVGLACFFWFPTYMIRRFGWPVGQVSLVIGSTTLASVPFTMLLGWFTDRCFRRGFSDAHFAIYAVLILVSAALIVVGAASSEAWMAAALFGVGLGMLTFVGVASAALQLVTPNEFRGQISVLFLSMVSIIGQGLGPSIPPAISDFLFRNDMMVGWSMAATAAIAAPVAAALLWVGRPAMRQAVADAATWLPI